MPALAIAASQDRQPPVYLHEFQFMDGGKAIYYQLEKKPWQQVDVGKPVVNLVFVLSGSDCISMGQFLPQYFSGLEAESGRTQILILHKRHILPGSNGKACGDAYIRADHPSRWQADQLEFMRAQLAVLQKQGQKPQRLIMMGISEGAELAPVLARQLSATHLVLLSHAGMNALDVYAALAINNPRMNSAWQQLQAGLRLKPADPDASLLHGRSWRYWSEIASIPQTANLLALDIPILLGFGDADPVIPDQAIAQLRQHFQAAGKIIDVRRFPGAGHSLSAEEKNYLPDFMHQIDNWLLDSRP
ncbi:alpha/beta hydrolase [Undibacterium sp. JH2W]|uniref:alpha/beta hydrolase n=1 Tax=Undibacterium sp. JH2W TaxID=3413037 RepID=UPI003BF3D0D2